jgi:hypothetical protein
MVFGILRDIGKLAGEIVGSVVAVPVAVIAETMSIPVAVVKEAMESGCETYEEIREYFNDEY